MAEAYTPIYFSRAIDEMPDRFFIQGEFPITRNREEVFQTAALLDKPGFNSAGLSGSQLEDLIFCLAARPTQAITDILTERVTARLLGLMWAFFQYNYDNENISSVFSSIIKKRDKNDFEPKQGQIIFEKGFLTDCLGFPITQVKAGKAKLTEIITKYEILPDSPYFHDMLTRFFIQSPPQLIKDNFEFLVKLFETGPIPIMALIRYIDALMPDEYSPEATILITQKIGAPGQSDFWLDYPPVMSQKMLDWNKIHKITLAYKPDSRKYKFLTKYTPRINDAIYDEETNVLKILFGQFVIIDDMSDDNAFVFCADPAASLELKDTKRIAIRYTAKDFVVGGVKEDYLRISLAGLDKMYADEMFGVLLDM